MNRYVADCKHCDWESPPTDSDELAAVAGVGHLQETHAAVLAVGDVSYVRVWSFQELRVLVGTAKVSLADQPAPPAAPGPEPPEPHHEPKAKPHHEATKGR